MANVIKVYNWMQHHGLGYDDLSPILKCEVSEVRDCLKSLDGDGIERLMVGIKDLVRSQLISEGIDPQDALPEHPDVDHQYYERCSGRILAYRGHVEGETVELSIVHPRNYYDVTIRMPVETLYELVLNGDLETLKYAVESNLGINSPGNFPFTRHIDRELSDLACVIAFNGVRNQLEDLHASGEPLTDARIKPIMINITNHIFSYLRAWVRSGQSPFFMALLSPFSMPPRYWRRPKKVPVTAAEIDRIVQKMMKKEAADDASPSV